MTNKSHKQPRSLLAEWTTLTKKRIAVLASLAAFVVSIVGGFVQPIGSSERRAALLSLSPFLITVLAGLIFFASQQWGRKAQSKRWFLICITSFIFSIGSLDRKSTRLNSSHSQISYAVFCLKKKKNKK